MLLDRPVVAFDIETIPDPDIGRRVLEIEGSEAEVVREMVRRRREETDGKTDYPALPWHRVVAICATVLDPKANTVQVRALAEEDDLEDERSILRGFFGLVTRELHEPRLTSWNGSGFDLPVIRYRSIVHGISAPSFYRTEGPWKWNHYHNRYHDMHLDVMDVLSSYGASPRVGLGMWGQTLGSAGKNFLERPIYDHVLEGELPIIREYCKLDTVETLLTFLSLAHHVGDLRTADLRRHVEAICETIATLPFEGWRRIEPILRAWPPWAQAAQAPPTDPEGS